MAQDTEISVDFHALVTGYYCCGDNSIKKREKIIQELLAKDNVNYQIPSKHPFRGTNDNLFGSTALHIAIKIWDYENFKVLMNNGADYTIKNVDNETPVHLIVKKLYTNPNQSSKLRECLDLVMSMQIKSQNYLNPRNNHGLSHFHAACIGSQTNLITLYLQNGVSTDEAVDMESKFFPGYTAMHFATYFSCPSVAKLLLSQGANVNCKEFQGLTPLDSLIKRNMEIVDWVNMGKRTCYYKLKKEYEQNEEIIVMIMEQMQHQDTNQLSSLHLSCLLQDTSKLELELQKKNTNLDRSVDVNSQLWPGYTPLHFAAHFNPKSVKLLLDNGANFFIKNSEGFTPFDLYLQRYDVQNLLTLMKSFPSWKKIRFVGTGVMLSRALSAMESEKSFTKFLKSLINISMPIRSNSQIFSRYTVLHLAITLSEKNQDEVDQRGIYESEDQNLVEHFNCSKEQEEIYLQRIKMCLESGADITAKISKGSTPLHLAFTLHKESAVNLLLDSYKEKDDFMNEDNLCHLHVACAAGNKAMVEELISKSTEHVNRAVTTAYKFSTSFNGKRVEFDIVSGSTPLHMAVLSRNLEIVKLLMDHNADKYARDSNELTPIHQIFVQGSKSKVIDSRLKEIANVLLASDDLKECETSFGLSHLHIASYVNNITAIEKLLVNGVNIDVAITSEKSTSHQELKFLKDLADYTSLDLAEKYDCEDASATLIQSGAKIATVSRKLVYDSRVKHSDFIATKVIDELASKEDFQKYGLTKLHAACATLNVEQVRELLDGGADPNVQISEDSPLWPGDTALHFVVIKRATYPMDRIREIINLLVDRKAVVTLKNLENETALHRAINLVVDSNADFITPPQFYRAHTDFKINPSSQLGISHFHIACYNGPFEVVEDLLKNGAIEVNQKIDFGARYWAGKTPLHIAAHYKRYNVVKLLLTYGADVYSRNDVYGIPLHEAAYFYKHVRVQVDEKALMRLVKSDNDIHSTSFKDRTALELLLHTRRSTTDSFRFFLKEKNRVNLFDSNGGGYMAITISNDSKVEDLLKNTYFATAINVPEANGPDEMGRTPIHNIVSLSARVRLSILQPTATTDVYIKALEQLIQVGFNIDHRDSAGRTPLHAAVEFQNAKGFTALLTLGADINITDKDERTPLFHISKWFEIENSDIKEAQKEILKVSLDRIQKMQYTGIYVNDSNMSYEATLRKHVSESNETTKENWQVEKENLMNKAIDSRQWKLGGFLFETGLVASYPKLRLSERHAIDNFFETNKAQLLEEYAHFYGLLMLQHRKAQARVDLIKLARILLGELFNYRLPDICRDCVLKYLSNEHLKKLTEKL